MDTGGPLGKASGRTLQLNWHSSSLALLEFTWVMASVTLKFSNKPPSEALKGGLPVSVLHLVGTFING